MIKHLVTVISTIQDPHWMQEITLLPKKVLLDLPHGRLLRQVYFLNTAPTYIYNNNSSSSSDNSNNDDKIIIIVIILLLLVIVTTITITSTSISITISISTATVTKTIIKVVSVTKERGKS